MGLFCRYSCNSVWAWCGVGTARREVASESRLGSGALHQSKNELSSVISLANGFGYLQSIPEYVLRGIYDKIVVNLMGDGKIFPCV